MLTLDDTLKITQIVHDAQKIPQDITRFADAKRWSESNGCFMRYGDMPLHYLIRALLKDVDDRGETEILSVSIR